MSKLRLAWTLSSRRTLEPLIESCCGGRWTSSSFSQRLLVYRSFHGFRHLSDSHARSIVSRRVYSPFQRSDGGGVVTSLQTRLLWGWLNSIFNRVDDSRIQEVGPDRACAEWLLRCGAGVKWDKGADEWLRDYNSLPVGNYRTLKIVEIDATDSAIMHIGFPHFRGLKHVRKAVFHRCGYMEDECVRSLSYLKETLEELQISSCGNITDEGIMTLTQMKNLKKLTLYDFLEVRNRKKCLADLQAALPNCDIYFPFAREEDRDPPNADSKSRNTRSS